MHYYPEQNELSSHHHSPDPYPWPIHREVRQAFFLARDQMARPATGLNPLGLLVNLGNIDGGPGVSLATQQATSPASPGSPCARFPVSKQIILRAHWDVGVIPVSFF
jgi:hypothetical protein